jgi:hypothetical protein
MSEPSIILSQTEQSMGNRFAFQVLCFAVGLAVLASTASAAEGVAGKWSGTVDVRDSSSGTVISTPIEVKLDEPQAGAVAGKIGRDGENDSVAIRDGKLDGDHLTFTAGSSETTGDMKFVLLLSGDRLEGQMKGAVESQEIEGKVKLNRTKN